MNTLLIIGGTGFFGNSILSYFSNSKTLKKKFNKIIIISRKKLKKFDYLKKLKKNYKVIKIDSDLLKLKKLPSANYVIYSAILKNYRYDYLAAKKYIKLAKIYHSNSKILYTSSGAVYGMQPSKIKQFKENYLIYNKKINFKKGYKQSYSNFKLKNEKIFQKLGNEGFNVSIARCFTFVGEYLRLNSNFVIGNIIKNILDGKNIKINANYKIYRSYMYADDLVKWLLKILDNSSPHCPIYNVGSNNKISIHQLANILAEKYNIKIDNNKISSKKIDNYMPDINKGKKVLGLKIHNTSIEGIIKTVNILSKKNYRDPR